MPPPDLPLESLFHSIVCEMSLTHFTSKEISSLLYTTIKELKVYAVPQFGTYKFLSLTVCFSENCCRFFYLEGSFFSPYDKNFILTYHLVLSTQDEE